MPTVPVDLRAALHDLDDVVEEAQEEGFSHPGHQALENARRLLQDLYRLHPCRLEIYPTPDSEVALCVPGGRGRSVLVLCDSDGGALCLVNLKGRHRRARYSNAAMLPDSFVLKALGALGERD